MLSKITTMDREYFTFSIIHVKYDKMLLDFEQSKIVFLNSVPGSSTKSDTLI